MLDCQPSLWSDPCWLLSRRRLERNRHHKLANTVHHQWLSDVVEHDLGFLGCVSHRQIRPATDDAHLPHWDAVLRFPPMDYLQRGVCHRWSPGSWCRSHRFHLHLQRLLRNHMEWNTNGIHRGGHELRHQTQTHLYAEFACAGDDYRLQLPQPCRFGQDWLEVLHCV